MRKEAREILKTAFAAHSKHLLSNSSVCFGLLKDYGGNDHPEVKLLADAIDQDIPRRLLDHGSVSTEMVDRLAREFAERRFYDGDLCRWAVESWAIVLGLRRDDDKLVSSIPNPVSTGYPERRYAETRVDQNLAGPGKQRDDDKLVPSIPNTVSTGYSERTYAEPKIHQSLGGIARLPYVGIMSGITIASGVLQAGAGHNTGMGGTVLLLTIVAWCVAVALRLKNIGRSSWLCLLTLIPIVSLFIYIPCLYAPTNYANTKKLDHAGKAVVWILCGLIALIVLVVIISALHQNS